MYQYVTDTPGKRRCCKQLGEEVEIRVIIRDGYVSISKIHTNSVTIDTPCFKLYNSINKVKIVNTQKISRHIQKR